VRGGLALALVLLGGCAGPGTEDPGMQLGTGEVEFEAVQDGDTLPVIRGPQGGYHVLGSLLAKGLEAGDSEDLTSDRNPTVTFDVMHGGESILLIGPFTQGLDDAPSSADPFTHQVVGRFLILSATDAELDGETVTISVRIDDVDGVSLDDEISVELEPHPFNN